MPAMVGLPRPDSGMKSLRKINESEDVGLGVNSAVTQIPQESLLTSVFMFSHEKWDSNTLPINHIALIKR
jgi:hypothetical protein